MKKQSKLFLLVLTLAVMVVLFALSASAATYTVAEGGDLASAVSSAASGDTIHVTGNVAVSSTITLNKDLTFTGSGTISWSGADGVGNYIFSLSGGYTIYFNGVSLAIPEGKIACFMNANNASTVNISAGNFTSSAADAGARMFRMSDSNVIINVTGGHFTVGGSGTCFGKNNGTLNISGSPVFTAQNSASIIRFWQDSTWQSAVGTTISGGSFSHSGSGHIFFFTNGSGEGSYPRGSLTVNGGSYTHTGTGNIFKVAVNLPAALTDGVTLAGTGGTYSAATAIVSLVSGRLAVSGTMNIPAAQCGFEYACTAGTAVLTFDASANIVLTGSGATAFRLAEGITAGGFSGTGKFTFTDNVANAYIAVKAGQNVSIGGGTFDVSDLVVGARLTEATAKITLPADSAAKFAPHSAYGTGTAFILNAAATLDIKGGSIASGITAAEGGTSYAGIIPGGNAEVNISGGSFTGFYIVRPAGTATVTISGGTFTDGGLTNTQFFNLANNVRPTFTITGGTFTSAGYIANVNEDGYFNISGGTFTGTGTLPMIRISDAEMVVKISGGKFIQQGTGVIIEKNNGTLDITNGTFTSDADATMLYFTRESKTNTISGGTFTNTRTKTDTQTNSNVKLIVFPVSSGCAAGLTISGGTFTVNGGNVIDFTPANVGAYLRITGGTFTQNAEKGTLITCRNAGKTTAGYTAPDGKKYGFVIEGGTFKAPTGTCINAAGAAIYVGSGTLTAGVAVVSYNDNDVISDVTIAGGDLNATGEGVVLQHAATRYDKRFTAWKAGILTVTGGNLTAQNGRVLSMVTTKENVPYTVSIKGGNFKTAGDAVIWVSAPSVYGSLVIEGGTFTLLPTNSGSGIVGGAVLRTGVNAHQLASQQVEDSANVQYQAGIVINLLGGRFINQRSGSDQIINTSVGNAVVTVDGATLLAKYELPYFYFAGKGAANVSMTADAPQCYYGGVLHYLWTNDLADYSDRAPVLAQGAGVRVNDSSDGIRFTSNVSAAAIEKLIEASGVAGYTVNNITFGTLIAPADYVVVAGGFTAAKLQAYAQKMGLSESTVFVDVKAKASKQILADGSVTFNAALVNIKSGNTERSFAAISYAEINGVRYYSSFDIVDNARTMADVAAGAIRDLAPAVSGDYFYPSDYNSIMFSKFSPDEQTRLNAYCNLSPLTVATVSYTDKLLYASSASSNLQADVKSLASTLGASYGTSTTSATNSVLVGSTGHADTNTALAKIRGNGYYIGKIGTNVVVVGTTNALTMMALQTYKELATAGDTTLSEIIVSDVKLNHLNADTSYVFPYQRDGNLETGRASNRLTAEIPVSNGLNEIPNPYLVDIPAVMLLNLRTSKLGEGRLSTTEEVDDEGKHVPARSTTVFLIPDHFNVGGTVTIYMGAADNAVTQSFLDGSLKQNNNAYGYQIKDGNIVIAAYNDTNLRKAVELFKTDMQDLAVSGGYALPDGYSRTVVKTDSAGYVSLPVVPDGLRLDGAADLGQNTSQYYYSGVFASDFTAYCNKLTSNGYSLYMSNEIAGSKFNTYLNSAKTKQVHVIYAAYTYADSETMGPDETPLSEMFEKSLRIIVSDVDGTQVNYIPSSWRSPSTDHTKLIAQTRITMVELSESAVGACFVIALENGHFVVVDGGGGSVSEDMDTDAYHIYEALASHFRDGHGGSNPTTDDPIIIDAWYMTHSHNDHSYTFAHNFMKTYVSASGAKVKLNAVLANYVSDDQAYNCFDANLYHRNQLGTSSWPFKNSDGSSIPYYKVHTGQKFYFCNVKFEVMYTYEDLYPWFIEYFNDSSTIMRMTTVDGTEAIFLGDLQYRGSKQLRAMYGKELKSDMVQVSHHAGWGADADLYRLINASVVFIPSNFDRIDMGNNGSQQQYVNRFILNETNWAHIVVADFGYNPTYYITSSGINYSYVYNPGLPGSVGTNRGEGWPVVTPGTVYALWNFAPVSAPAIDLTKDDTASAEQIPEELGSVG